MIQEEKALTWQSNWGPVGRLKFWPWCALSSTYKIQGLPGRKRDSCTFEIQAGADDLTPSLTTEERPPLIGLVLVRAASENTSLLSVGQVLESHKGSLSLH